MQCPTAAIITKTTAAPIHAAPAMPSEANVADRPNNGAPRIKRATPRLAPELMPRT